MHPIPLHCQLLNSHLVMESGGTNSDDTCSFILREDGMRKIGIIMKGKMGSEPKGVIDSTGSQMGVPWETLVTKTGSQILPCKILIQPICGVTGSVLLRKNCSTFLKLSLGSFGINGSNEEVLREERAQVWAERNPTWRAPLQGLCWSSHGS